LDRLDLPVIKDRTDLATVATDLFGQPAKRQGRRLLWLCPFHDDHHPSLDVDLKFQSWRCWSCGAKGDAIELAMRIKGMTFPEAVRFLADRFGVGIASVGNAHHAQTLRPLPSPTAATKPARAAATPSERSSGLPLEEAWSLVTDAAPRLWKPEGRKALDYLRGRCLTDEAIHAARIGWAPRAAGAPWKPPGVVIPWFDGDRLALVKIRPPDEWRKRFPVDRRPPKYVEAFRDRPSLYPGPEAIRQSRAVVITEGELDQLLLAQELRDLVAVVTLGSAAMRPGTFILTRLLAAPVWFIALDADEAGDRGASEWPARARRVRPPGGCKDWTEAVQGGVNLTLWWRERFEDTPR
jgi:DNA primase